MSQSHSQKAIHAEKNIEATGIVDIVENMEDGETEKTQHDDEKSKAKRTDSKNPGVVRTKPSMTQPSDGTTPKLSRAAARGIFDVVRKVENGSKRLLEEFAKRHEEDVKKWKTLEPDLVKSFHEHMVKNRSANICLEENRVVLNDQLPGDYIHASYIEYNGRKRYIATQAPKIDTVVDFWRMVWQTDTRLIVCLANFRDLDAGHTCCYWPLRPTEIHRYGPVMVRNVAFTEGDTWVETLLELAWYCLGVRRRITHLMYSDWDENCVPRSLDSLTKFRNRMSNVIEKPMEVRTPKDIEQVKKKEMEEGTGPIIVHCTDGAGRTGAFIILDLCMTEMERNQKHDTVDEVMHLVRNQRPFAIQTANQYLSVYMANMTYARAINKNLKLEDFAAFKNP